MLVMQVSFIKQRKSVKKNLFLFLFLLNFHKAFSQEAANNYMNFLDESMAFLQFIGNYEPIIVNGTTILTNGSEQSISRYIIGEANGELSRFDEVALTNYVEALTRWTSALSFSKKNHATIDQLMLTSEDLYLRRVTTSIYLQNYKIDIENLNTAHEIQSSLTMILANNENTLRMLNEMVSFIIGISAPSYWGGTAPPFFSKLELIQQRTVNIKNVNSKIDLFLSKLKKEIEELNAAHIKSKAGILMTLKIEKANLDTKLAQFDSIQQVISNLTKEVNDLQTENKKLTALLSEINASITENKIRVSRLNTEINNLTSTRNNLNSELSNLIRLRTEVGKKLCPNGLTLNLCGGSTHAQWRDARNMEITSYSQQINSKNEQIRSTNDRIQVSIQERNNFIANLSSQEIKGKKLESDIQLIKSKFKVAWDKLEASKKIAQSIPEGKYYITLRDENIRESTYLLMSTK
jgi:DNA repair exonuclease SbcCD ATPase subunit